MEDDLRMIPDQVDTQGVRIHSLVSSIGPTTVTDTMACRGEILPILLLICLPVFCFITYGIAVGLGHVNAAFPYISKTGSHPPESCVFGLLFGLYAFLVTICVFIRYEQARIKYSGRATLRRTNNIALIVGLTSAFGVYLVANFQESNVLTVHLIGAAFAFVGGNVYCWIQTAMTFRMKDLPGYRSWMRFVRLGLTVLHLVSCIAVVTGFSLARKAGDDNVHGYSAHIVSTAMELVLVITTAIYFFTFTPEFRNFRIKFPTVHYLANFDINEMIHGNSNGTLNEVKVSKTPE